jgi:hypothetical protein
MSNAQSQAQAQASAQDYSPPAVMTVIGVGVGVLLLAVVPFAFVFGLVDPYRYIRGKSKYEFYGEHPIVRATFRTLWFGSVILFTVGFWIGFMGAL